MVTYDMTKADGPLYVYLYQCLKDDITSGRLPAGVRLPSKRTLAGNLGVSTITIENAYGQLESEGYIQSVPKKGYYVSDIPQLHHETAVPKTSPRSADPAPSLYDMSLNKADINSFPFSVWSKLMRETLADRPSRLLDSSEKTGVYELREAIARHLASYRGMSVDPDRIVIGAGTEYLYGIIVNLLGRDKIFCVENPGYAKPKQIYESNDVRCVYADLDDSGIRVDKIRSKQADVIHICPTHQFPTGITMPVSRRYELLVWANEDDRRYIIEDDYDSEFRMSGKPISTFFSIDAGEKVIYMNTFSKSLAPTIRISYMVLPEHLMRRYREHLGFYSCPVPTFEQYTLAAFISRGFFEKHINRMRLYYGRKRQTVIDTIQSILPLEKHSIIENDSGLHFNLRLDTPLSDADFKARLLASGIRINALTDHYLDRRPADQHIFIINYSGLDPDTLPDMITKIGELL